MNRKEIVELLTESKKEIQKFGVKQIGLFGSFSRGENREDSDVDIVVEFEREKGTFKNFAGLIDYLEMENMSGRPVDTITPAGIEAIRIEEIKEEIK